MEETAKKTNNAQPCNGNCMMCSVMQRQYCSTQIAYNTMRMLEQLPELLSKMQDSIKDVQESVRILSGDGIEILKPIKTDIAQEGSGADIIGSQNNPTN